MRKLVFAGGALAALSLAACNQLPAAPSASSQPVAEATPAELTPAPVAQSLPAAPSAPVRYAPPERRYQYVNDAYAMSQTYADAPPDYAFDYEGGAPQAWGSRDGVVRVGEPVAGGWRYYYYRPGSSAPYFVRDPEYGYAYEDGALVAVYDHGGRALEPSYADRQAWLAGRYLARARALWLAARDNQRHRAGERAWRDSQRDQMRERDDWARGRDSDPDWRRYHDDHRDEAEARWGQVAIAWATSQGGGRPQGPGYGPRGPDRVDSQRDAWRARMSQQGGGQYQPQGPDQGPPQGQGDGHWQGGPQGQPQGQGPNQGGWGRGPQGGQNGGQHPPGPQAQPQAQPQGQPQGGRQGQGGWGGWAQQGGQHQGQGQGQGQGPPQGGWVRGPQGQGQGGQGQGGQGPSGPNRGGQGQGGQGQGGQGQGGHPQGGQPQGGQPQGGQPQGGQHTPPPKPQVQPQGQPGLNKGHGPLVQSSRPGDHGDGPRQQQ